MRFRGQVDGIEVFREQANVLLDPRGGLVAVGGFAMGAPATQRKRAEAVTRNPEAALASALADYRFDPAIARMLQKTGASDGYASYALPPASASDDGSALRAARVKRVWFRLPAELVPAWYIEVQVKDGAWPHGVDYYAYVVSAVDNALLFRHNQTADAAFSYRVYAEPTPPFLPLPGPAGRGAFPHPTGTPDGFQPPFVAPNLVTLESAPFSRNDPWLLPNAVTTVGQQRRSAHEHAAARRLRHPRHGRVQRRAAGRRRPPRLHEQRANVRLRVRPRVAAEREPARRWWRR